jgi:hypothetical protein
METLIEIIVKNSSQLNVRVVLLSFIHNITVPLNDVYILAGREKHLPFAKHFTRGELKLTFIAYNSNGDKVATYSPQTLEPVMIITEELLNISP